MIATGGLANDLLETVLVQAVAQGPVASFVVVEPAIEFAVQDVAVKLALTDVNTYD